MKNQLNMCLKLCSQKLNVYGLVDPIFTPLLMVNSIRMSQPCSQGHYHLASFASLTKKLGISQSCQPK